MAFRRGRERGRYRVGALGGLLALLALLAPLGGLILPVCRSVQRRRLRSRLPAPLPVRDSQTIPWLITRWAPPHPYTGILIIIIN